MYIPYELLSKLLKGGYKGAYIGDYYRGYSGDTRSLDSSSYTHMDRLGHAWQQGSFECSGGVGSGALKMT